MFSSKIYLSKSKYENNINFIRKLAGKNTRISSVVKSNAYGHGLKEFVPLAENSGIDHFSVFSQDEAVKVKKYCKKETSIMIMGFISFEKIDWIVKNDVETSIFNYPRIEKIINSAKKLNKKAKIHIELETGLNRTGFTESEIPKLIRILKKNKKYLKIMGLCTHFAGAESISNYHRIKRQIKRFKKHVESFKKAKINYGILHVASSAAMVTHPKTRFDMVRVGIMQYGFWPTDETKMFYLATRKKKIDPLVPILKWESEIMNIKNVSMGEYVGYSDYYLAKEDMRIGTVPIGYSQGYGRILSNNSWILVNGKIAEVIGIINMNLFQVDLTNLPNTKIGDKVTLVGREGDNEVRFAAFNERKTSLNYEILTKLSENIPRIITK